MECDILVVSSQSQRTGVKVDSVYFFLFFFIIPSLRFLCNMLALIDGCKNRRRSAVVVTIVFFFFLMPLFPVFVG